MDRKAYIEPRRALVEARLDALLPPETATPRALHRAMRYSALAGGKRFRPLCCLAANEACGAEHHPTAVLSAGCALEFVHCFSLIHDDLPALDDDDLRRGRPTAHVEFGEAIAILAGDALFCLAFETLASLDAPTDVRAAACLAVARASGTAGMVGGQVVDLESEGAEADAETVAWIHERKTGRLIAAACEVGALIAGGSESDAAACKEIGARIGLAFQIRDDILDETSDEEKLGKRPGVDRARSKSTYPAAFGIVGSRRLAAQAVEEAVALAHDLPGDSRGLQLLAELAAEREF